MTRTFYIVAGLFVFAVSLLKAQTTEFPELVITENDSIVWTPADSAAVVVGTPVPEEADTSRFSPDPMKAVWYSALFPGLGQIYNRRYWKLPIVIGGFMGLTYATTWNGRYYKDYSIAYRDAMDDDPSTKSYLNFLPPHQRDEENLDMAWLQSSLKRKKDSYRRYRDLCIISMIGVYLVCMVDAYVDAQLYNFNISPDVALKVTPAVIEPSRFNQASIGLQCAITF